MLRHMDSATPRPTPYLIGSVDNALVVLRLLHDRGAMSVSDLGAELGVARSTAHRILGTLMHHGFVEQDRLTRSYRLGPFFTQQGVESKAILHLRNVAMPILHTLSTEFDETVQLIVLEGANCRFVDGISGNRPLKTSVQAGSLLPAYATASGKALLAELDDETVATLYNKKLAVITDQTIPTLATLLAQLAKIRRDGYSINDGETEDGVSALAAPIRDHRGAAVGAVALSLPSMRMRPESTRRMLPRLLACATAIGDDLVAHDGEGNGPWS
jgi:DNA-binding IclR family transcriptional regulator